MNNQIIFFSFWYPNKYKPDFCNFIREHARAIFTQEKNFSVLAVHFVKSNNFLNKYTEEHIDKVGFKETHLYIESVFFKFIQINPWLCKWLLML